MTNTSILAAFERMWQHVVATVSTKADINHKHDGVYDEYGAAAAVKNDLLNGAGAAYDILKELGDLIDENVDAIEALEQVAANKVSTTDIVDNLTTENASLPLSANQGVILQSKITEVSNAVQANADVIAGITAIPDSEIIALFSS